MEKENKTLKETEEQKGEELLEEYFAQDTEDKHHMGYSIYTRTEGDGCCC